MNKKILGIALCGVMLWSCSENDRYDTFVPGEYNDILALRESGETEVKLFKTGEDGVYSLTVMQGGTNVGATSKATVRVMNESELQEYAAMHDKLYALLPANLYEFNTMNVDLTANMRYQKENITFKTNDIETFVANNTSVTYVLPLILESQTDSVNIHKKLVVLKPQVVIPSVAFAAGTRDDVAVSGQSTTYNLRLSLPFESSWDFTCKIAIDETGRVNGYEKINADAYTLADEGVVTFRKGSRVSEPLAVTLKNGALLGSSYFLPFKVTEVSKPGFTLPGTFYLYTGFNAIALTSSMLSTNAQEPTEGPIANLIDGNNATFFHSRWSAGGNITGAHHIQVKLENAITSCRFSYVNRAIDNGKPSDISVLVSQDGENWTELTRINSGLPTGSASSYLSPIMQSTTPFTYFRLVVNRSTSGAFFNMAEFQLYGK